MKANENNLVELNDILFDTLRDVKAGEMDLDRARRVVNVSSTIIDNAKVQLDAFKFTNGSVFTDFFSETKNIEHNKEKGEYYNKQITPGEKYDRMNDYATKKGYKSVTDAMNKMGKSKFLQAFENSIK